MYYGIDFNGDGINDMGERFIDLSPVKPEWKPYTGRKKRREMSAGSEIGCFMALVVGVTFFILSYL